ncbi:hypothetical protein DPMN_079559 [Dreissena polymorpha]|uniref:BZIP domain-containing protein n=2 Tax=Dreissena polymorpha TaxID=45954 RepID=A0A9D3YUP2_DREPO|nr:hypothetical protein DPMN_079559 [Dreissena polymorpha]
MEATIIGSDVGFGTESDPLFGFNQKSSPSHQSDSGCSDLFDMDERSVSPSSGVGLFEVSPDEGSTVKLFDFDAIATESVCSFDENELENELEGYLCSASSNRGKRSVRSVLTDGGNNSRPQSDDSEIDVESEKDDPTYVPCKPNTRVIWSKAVTGSKAVVPKANIIKMPSVVARPAEVHVLPATSTTFLKKGQGEGFKPAVKVVKVIKTAAQSKQDIDNELFQALDERNKKNAVQAKLNREKKKAYINSLQDEIEKLREENATIQAARQKDITEKKALLEEVEYLKSVLANESAIAGLLKNIGNVNNVKLSTSFGKKRNADLDDHDYSNVSQKKSRNAKTAGVCLHVDDGSVSLEFCSKCSSMSKSSDS